MYHGILLDFYDTLVHEDDDIISVICDAICQNTSTPVTSREFGLFTGAYGPAFIPQRDAARRSLVDTFAHVGADLDPDALLKLQLGH